MAALIRQANNWNQMARWKGWWKWWRKIKEKGMGKNPLLPPNWKPYMVTNSLWQRAMWQRLETLRNPCTQNKPHTDANSHWTLNKRSRSTHIKIIIFNPVVSTGEAPQGYSHHPHIEKEQTRSKRERKERKNKLNSRSVYQEPHWPKHETLTQGKHKVSSLIN